MVDSWIPVSEAVKISGYHAEHIRKLVRARRVKARKFGVVWQINSPSLQQYVRTQSQLGKKRGPKGLT
jgi:hypothetical protein